MYGDEQNREFVTASRKKLGFYPQKLFLESVGECLKLSMEDLMGIQMDSNKNISLIAGRKVCMEGKNISVTAPLEILFRTPEANIEICRDFNFYAPGGVRTVGNGDVSENQTKLPAEKPNNGGRIEHWRASFSAMAAVPAADFGKRNSADGRYHKHRWRKYRLRKCAKGGERHNSTCIRGSDAGKKRE